MQIGEYLIQQRRRVIRSYYRGFDSGPAHVPITEVVPTLSDLRRSRFLSFRKGLKQDGVLLIKMLPTMDMPERHDALFLGDLRGNLQVINLGEVEEMTKEEKTNNDGPLYDIRTLLTNQNYLRIVEQAAEVLKLGERLGIDLDPTKFTPLQFWHPKMPRDIWGSLKFEFPAKWEQLTLAFKGSEEPGWRWDLQPMPEILGPEQARLAFAMGAAMISLTLDGFVLNLFGTEYEKENQDRLAACVDEVIMEETVATMERLTNLEIRSQGGESVGDQRKAKTVTFKQPQGVVIGKSLPFGLMRIVEVNEIQDGPVKVLRPQRHYIRDLVEWEEELEWIQVVPALPIIEEETVKLPEAKKSCLKSYKKQDIKYDVGYIADPDYVTAGAFGFRTSTLRGRPQPGGRDPPPLAGMTQNNLNEEKPKAKTRAEDVRTGL